MLPTLVVPPHRDLPNLCSNKPHLQQRSPLQFHVFDPSLLICLIYPSIPQTVAQQDPSRNSAKSGRWSFLLQGAVTLYAPHDHAQCLWQPSLQRTLESWCSLIRCYSYCRISSLAYTALNLGEAHVAYMSWQEDTLPVSDYFGTPCRAPSWQLVATTSIQVMWLSRMGQRISSPMGGSGCQRLICHSALPRERQSTTTTGTPSTRLIPSRATLTTPFWMRSQRTPRHTCTTVAWRCSSELQTVR